MFTFIDDILVIKERKNIIFFDPNKLLVFSKPPNVSNQKAVNKYKECIKDFPKEEIKPSPSKDYTSVSLELNITDNCNLRCKYCYLEKNHMKTNSNMTENTIEKTFDFIKQTFPKVQTMKIFLFGGEPILFWKKFDYLLKTAKEKFKEKKVFFVVATNGTILNEKILSFMKQENVFFCFSIDGPKKIQDQLRITEKNLGSHDIIFKNLPLFKKTGRPLEVRAVITNHNMDFTNLFEYFKKEGFQKIIFTSCASKELGIHQEHLPILKKELEKFSNIYFEHIIKKDKFIKVIPFLNQIQKLHTKRKQKCRCRAGKNLFAVSTDEKIYYCHRFLGNKKFQIGDLDNGFYAPYNPYQTRKKLLEFDVQNIKKCKNCFAKYICGGGCLHEQLASYSTTSCDVTRLFFSFSIQLYFKLLKHPNFDKKLNILFKNNSLKEALF